MYCYYFINGNVNKARPFVFIDEAQDLSASELELIKKLNNNPKINLFGDINQVMPPHGIDDWSKVTEGFVSYQLDENFRNTNQIVDFCNRILPFKMRKIGVDMEAVEQLASVDHALSKGRLPNGVTFIVKDEQVIVIDRGMTSNEKCISYTRALAKLTVIHDMPSLSDPATKRIVEGEEGETA